MKKFSLALLFCLFAVPVAAHDDNDGGGWGRGWEYRSNDYGRAERWHEQRYNDPYESNPYFREWHHKNQIRTYPRYRLRGSHEGRDW
jgi:hypothetical protein